MQKIEQPLIWYCHFKRMIEGRVHVAMAEIQTKGRRLRKKELINFVQDNMTRMVC